MKLRHLGVLAAAWLLTGATMARASELEVPINVSSEVTVQAALPLLTIVAGFPANFNGSISLNQTVDGDLVSLVYQNGSTQKVLTLEQLRQGVVVETYNGSPIAVVKAAQLDPRAGGSFVLVFPRRLNSTDYRAVEFQMVRQGGSVFQLQIDTQSGRLPVNQAQAKLSFLPPGIDSISLSFNGQFVTQLKASALPSAKIPSDF